MIENNPYQPIRSAFQIIEYSIQGLNQPASFIATPISICVAPFTIAIDCITGVADLSLAWLQNFSASELKSIAHKKFIASPAQHLTFAVSQLVCVSAGRSSPELFHQMVEKLPDFLRPGGYHIFSHGIKVDLNPPRAEEPLSLHQAILNGNTALALELIKNGALIENNCLTLACNLNNQEVVNALIEHALSYISNLHKDFAINIQDALSTPDHIKTLFALTTLFKRCEYTREDAKKFIDLYKLTDCPKEEFFKELESAIRKDLRLLAGIIGNEICEETKLRYDGRIGEKTGERNGDQFVKDYVKYYEPTIQGLSFDCPFLTATIEEQKAMVYLRKKEQQRIEAKSKYQNLISSVSKRGFSRDAVESAIFDCLCSDKNPTETTIAPHLFEAVINYALGNLSNQKKAAIINLFDSINGKENLLTKEGQEGLIFLACKVASFEFAEGRSPSHFRVMNKFPAILKAMRIHTVNDLNQFESNELFQEMFDQLQQNAFKNVNVNELLESILANPKHAILSLITPLISSLLGKKKLDKETREIVQDIVESFTEILSGQIQILNRDDVKLVAKALEFNLTASTEVIFNELIAGIQNEWETEKNKTNEELSFTQVLIRSAADYLLKEAPQALQGWGAWFGIGVAKQLLSRKWIIQGLLSVAIPLLNKVLPYITSYLVKGYKTQIDDLKANLNKSSAENESLHTLEFQYELFTALNNVSPQLVTLAGKLGTHLINTLDLNKAKGYITEFQNYEAEGSEEEAKKQIVNGLYKSIITAVQQIQKATPNLLDNVLLGIKEIASKNLKKGDQEEYLTATKLEHTPKASQPVINARMTQLAIKLSSKSQPGIIYNAEIPADEYKALQTLLPEFEKEFGLLNNNETINQIINLMRRGCALIKNGYSPQEIALGCIKYWKTHLKAPSEKEPHLLYPFIFEATQELLIDEAIKSKNMHREPLLKEKLRFYLNQIKGQEILLKENGKAVLKAMIETLLEPQFCDTLLNPLLLERFPLILQGAKLFDVTLLNDLSIAEVRNNLINESEVCLKPINIGNIKNGLLINPEECMRRIAVPLVHALTPGLKLKNRQENERVVCELVNAFIQVTPIQTILSFARKHFQGYNLHGIELDIDLSLEGLARELKEITELKFVSPELAKTMLPTQLLLAITQQFSEAQGLRKELMGYEKERDKIEIRLRNLNKIKDYPHLQDKKTVERLGKTKETIHEIEKNVFEATKVQILNEANEEIPVKEAEVKDLNDKIKSLRARIATNKIATELQNQYGWKTTGASIGLSCVKLVDPSNTKMLETILPWVKPLVSFFISYPIDALIKEFEGKEDSKDIMLILKTIRANQDKIVDLGFDIVLANLSLLKDLSTFIDLATHLASLANNPSDDFNPDTFKRRWLNSINVVLDNILLFQNVIPTLFDSLRRVQALDLSAQWIQEKPQPRTKKAGKC